MCVDFVDNTASYRVELFNQSRNLLAEYRDNAEHRNGKWRGCVSFTISSALPAGLAFNTATGAITGTPTVSQTAKAYTVTAINGAGSATCVLNISVMAPPLGLSYSTNPATYNQNVAITQNTATVTGGAAQAS